MSNHVSFEVQTAAGDQISNDLIHIHIKNSTQTKKVLGTTNGHKVILEDLKQNRKEQLWKIGACDKDGYFTLENSNVPKFTTAISSTSLEIKGKISLRSITGWLTKGQLISKANCQAVNSSKKQTNDFVSTKGH